MGASIGSPSTAGRRQTQGIGGLIASMKEIEEKLANLEVAHESADT